MLRAEPANEARVRVPVLEDLMDPFRLLLLGEPLHLRDYPPQALFVRLSESEPPLEPRVASQSRNETVEPKTFVERKGLLVARRDEVGVVFEGLSLQLQQRRGAARIEALPHLGRPCVALLCKQVDYS